VSRTEEYKPSNVIRDLPECIIYIGKWTIAEGGWRTQPRQFGND